MKTKLWEKDKKINPLIESFTIGKDQELDMFIAPYDVIASKAHAKMLAKVKLITEDEEKLLLHGLNEIESLLQKGEFKIEAGVEDIHSQIELYLTSNYGDAGKKIHTARSRNDQVLTAIKLYLKDELKNIRKKSIELRSLFIQLAHENKGVLLPGYTHFQAAMPSSFDMWLGAWAESIDDDLELLEAAYRICDKNPLGSAAGFGSSFPIDREFTSREMGFAATNKSPVYAQMTRGKSEKAVAVALSSLSYTISRFSYDVCLYLCQNFNFISFPEELTTGSSIMPHKKNPDVFELLRAKCNVLQALPEQLTLLTNNLPSGYHRDMQLTKELIIPAIEQMKICLHVLLEVLPYMQVNKNCTEDEKYKYIFSVEEVNKLVMKGIPFREAYHIISESIRNNSFVPDTNVSHTHLGSIGNF
jgi:argininosuccinate lyase